MSRLPRTPEEILWSGRRHAMKCAMKRMGGPAKDHGAVAIVTVWVFPNGATMTKATTFGDKANRSQALGHAAASISRKRVEEGSA